MKKALIITTVSGFVPQFEMNNVQILQESGYEVHYASNFKHPHYGSDNHRLDGTGILCHQVDFVRSPFRIKENLQAYRQLKTVLEENSFDLLHCHTPMGGVLGRLAAERFRRKQNRSCKTILQTEKEKNADRIREMKVIYTAHGFHFFKGAPFINWLIYYPVERWLAHYTDVLITINEEDFRRAKKFHLRKINGNCGQVKKVNGVGIETEHFRNLTVNRNEKRRELGIPKDAYVLISVGELSKRKNHQVVIRAIASAKKELGKTKMYYLICGEGAEQEKLTRLIRRNTLEDTVLLLGYRTDIKELLFASDCFIFPSKQEGLPVALMEALAEGLPCICSDIRGNLDLAKEGDVELFNANNVRKCKEAVLKAAYSRKKKTASLYESQFEKEQVVKTMQKLYQQAGEKNG